MPACLGTVRWIFVVLSSPLAALSTCQPSQSTQSSSCTSTRSRRFLDAAATGLPYIATSGLGSMVGDCSLFVYTRHGFELNSTMIRCQHRHLHVRQQSVFRRAKPVKTTFSILKFSTGAHPWLCTILQVLQSLSIHVELLCHYIPLHALVDPVSFYNWLPSEPATEEACAFYNILITNINTLIPGWKAARCQERAAFICEIGELALNFLCKIVLNLFALFWLIVLYWFCTDFYRRAFLLRH